MYYAVMTYPKEPIFMLTAPNFIYCLQDNQRCAKHGDSRHKEAHLEDIARESRNSQTSRSSLGSLSASASSSVRSRRQHSRAGRSSRWADDLSGVTEVACRSSTVLRLVVRVEGVRKLLLGAADAVLTVLAGGTVGEDTVTASAVSADLVEEGLVLALGDGGLDGARKRVYHACASGITVDSGRGQRRCGGEPGTGLHSRAGGWAVGG